MTANFLKVAVNGTGRKRSAQPPSNRPRSGDTPEGVAGIDRHLAFGRLHVDAGSTSTDHWHPWRRAPTQNMPTPPTVVALKLEHFPFRDVSFQ